MFAIIVQNIFSVHLIVTYAYLKDFFPTKLIKIRGAFFGGFVWFSLIGMVFLFVEINGLKNHTPLEAIWENTMAVVYGIIAAIVLDKIEKKKAR